MSYLNFFCAESAEFTERSFDELLNQAEDLDTEYFHADLKEEFFTYMYEGELAMVKDEFHTYIEGGVEAKHALDYSKLPQAW